MSRIKSNNINFGSAFVIKTEEDLAQIELEKQKSYVIQTAQEKAQGIIDEAKAQAEEIVNNSVELARQESEAIKETAQKEGYQLGYENGYNDGREQIAKELEDKIINVDNFAQSTFEIKKRIIKSAHKDIIELVCAIAQRVCSKEFEQSDKILYEITQKAISLLKEKEYVNIIVNPKMASKIWEISDDLKEKIHGLENIKIIEDSSVGTDGTIVEGVKNRIDATITNQINVIADELYNELNSVSENTLVEEVEND